METFFANVLIRVLADERVQTLLRTLAKETVEEAVDRSIEQVITRIDGLDGKMGNLQEQVVGQVIGGLDGLDGKMGNLQEQVITQLAQLPAKMIGPTVEAVEQAIRNFNPFR